MKVVGLMVFLVGFAFPVVGQSQIITCGNLLDREFIANHCQGENPREEECGIEISVDQRFSPWFELREVEEGGEYELSFVDGLANLFRFDPEQAELIRNRVFRNSLEIELNAYSGHHSRVVLLTMNLFRRPARALDGFFYEGTINIILNYEKVRQLANSNALANHLASEIYRMPFACVTEYPLY